ncbi:MAG: HIT domain-containing protein [Magnetococcales bacterium]|nr:HIT domain-containing protein [Magnetococcales bacterium]
MINRSPRRCSATLATDTLELVRWPLCRVLLMNDARYPWLILVPQRPGMREIFDLSEEDQARLLGETRRAARALAAYGHPDKLNVAALGNVVAQLHLHVIARFVGDEAWPRPVWGVHPARPYGEAARQERLTALRRLLGEGGEGGEG